MYKTEQWYWVRTEHAGKDIPAQYLHIRSIYPDSCKNVHGWLLEGIWHPLEDVEEVISKIPTASHYAQMITILRTIGSYGEDMWDKQNFKNGLQKIPCGVLVRARKLLKNMGYEPEPNDGKYFLDL